MAEGLQQWSRECRRRYRLPCPIAVTAMPAEAWMPSAEMPSGQPQAAGQPPAAPRSVPEVEDLDIPAFLRRNRDH